MCTCHNKSWRNLTNAIYGTYISELNQGILEDRNALKIITYSFESANLLENGPFCTHMFLILATLIFVFRRIR
jgi:hypothetical protein